MDFLNKAFAQLADLFRSMTPGARITTVLLMAVLVASVGYLFTYHGTAADTFLMNGTQFSPAQLPAMEAAFAKANLNSYEFVGTKIRVPRSQQNAYMAALAEANALPENYGKILDDALANSNPWIDRQQREQLLKAARQKQLELVIRSMKGVQNAYVMYDIGAKHGFNKETPTTASVNVMPLAGQPLADAQVLAIRTLVARSIAGLLPENVAVTDLSNGRTLAGSGDGAASPLEDPYSSRKAMYETQWRDKIQHALSYVPGVTVSANVELDREKTRRKETVVNDPKTSAPISITERTRSSTSDSSTPAGRVGYAAQQPNTSLSLAGGSGKNSREEEKENETQTSNAISGTREMVEDVGLTPKRVTISIGLPQSYFQKIWLQRNPPADGQPVKPPDQAALDQIRQEETTKIKEHVAKLIPAAEGVTDVSQMVQVTTFQDIKGADLPGPGTADYVIEWLSNNWSTLAMAAVALIALVMLRSMVKSAPGVAAPARAASETSGSAAAAANEQKEEAAGATASAQRLRRFTGEGPTLRDEVSQLVQEDPDAAAEILKAWIGTPILATK